jgi:hypothetical protein
VRAKSFRQAERARTGPTTNQRKDHVTEQFIIVSDENTRIDLTAGVWLVSSVDKDPVRVDAGLARQFYELAINHQARRPSAA